MGFWVAMFIIAIVLAGVAVAMAEDCPRSMRGYNCRGKECDHSEEAIRQARIDMGLF